MRPILTDICWTLYRSNTTFDFLDDIIQDSGYMRLRRWMKNPLIRMFNLLWLRLTHHDIIRTKALRYLTKWSADEINQMADDFVRNRLETKRIEPSWKMIAGREVIIVSGTIRPIAEAVGRRVGATRVYCDDIFKEQAMLDCHDFDIITDNLSDVNLIRQAHHASIVTYGNRNRWEKLNLKNIEYLTDEAERY